MKETIADDSPDSESANAIPGVPVDSSSLGTCGGPTGAAWTLLLFELFVALAISISFFTLIRTYARGPEPCNPLSLTIGSIVSSYQMEQPGLESWKGRLPGILLGGWLVDLLADNNDQFANVFGLYHAFWLFLLFLVSICSLRNSLFLNLGIATALIYSFGPAAGMRVYPYDTAAALFFTLAILLHARQRYYLMLTVICAGCLFKETVLVCAILVFFGGRWTWRRRLIGFLAVVMVYVLARKWLMIGLHMKPSEVGIAYAHSLGDLIPKAWVLVQRNVAKALSGQINHVAFVNVGTLMTVLLLGWRQRRYLPYRILIVLFVAGQFVFGLVDEFRVFLEVLPLGWMLLSEYWGGFERPGVAVASKLGSGKASDQSCGGHGEGSSTMQETSEDASRVMGERIWPFRGSGLGLSVMSVVMVVSCTLLVGWRYGVVAYTRNPNHPTRVVEAQRIKAENGNAQAQFALGMHYLNGEGVATNLNEAFQWIRKAADQGNSGAAFVLGMCCVRGEGTPQSDEDGIMWFRKAIELSPRFSDTYNELGAVFLWQGRTAEAVEQFMKVLEINPLDADAHYNLGKAYATQNLPAEAIEHFQKALEARPDWAEVHNNLGGVLAAQGRSAEAIEYFQKALEFKPDDAEIHNRLAILLQGQGKFDAAIAHYQKVLELQPQQLVARNNLAWLLATCPEATMRNGIRAVELAQGVMQAGGDQHPMALDTLAAAYAEAGRFAEAVEAARRALDLAGAKNDGVLAGAIRARLKLYEGNFPYHEKP